MDRLVCYIPAKELPATEIPDEIRMIFYRQAEGIVCKNLMYYSHAERIACYYQTGKMACYRLWHERPAIEMWKE